MKIILSSLAIASQTVGCGSNSENSKAQDISSLPGAATGQGPINQPLKLTCTGSEFVMQFKPEISGYGYVSGNQIWSKTWEFDFDKLPKAGPCESDPQDKNCFSIGGFSAVEKDSKGNTYNINFGSDLNEYYFTKVSILANNRQFSTASSSMGPRSTPRNIHAGNHVQTYVNVSKIDGETDLYNFVDLRCKFE